MCIQWKSPNSVPIISSIIGTVPLQNEGNIIYIHPGPNTSTGVRMSLTLHIRTCVKGIDTMCCVMADPLERSPFIYPLLGLPLLGNEAGLCCQTSAGHQSSAEFRFVHLFPSNPGVDNGAWHWRISSVPLEKMHGLGWHGLESFHSIVIGGGFLLLHEP